MDRNRLRDLLNQLHQALGEARTADPESRRLLGTVMSDIERVLQQPASGQGDTPASQRLEELVVRYEADHPGIAGAMRQLIDALAKAGI
jgi:Domain of unknown function (DUF4404)